MTSIDNLVLLALAWKHKKLDRTHILNKFIRLELLLRFNYESTLCNQYISYT